MRIRSSLFLVVFTLAAGVTYANESVGIVRTMIDLVNHRDLDALSSVIADDIVRHSAATPGVAVTSLDEFKAFLEQDFAGIPDAVQEVDISFGAGDKVAVRARYIGTQTGQMGPFPPSGKRVELPFMAILRIENDKIAEMWVEWDNISFLTQLGHLPAPQ